jgi:hypothetical protein
MSDLSVQENTNYLDVNFLKEHIVDIDWPEDMLPQEKLFVSFYISDAHWDSEKAYLMAGMEPKKTSSATRIKAHQLLNTKKIQDAVNTYVNSVVEINKGRAKVGIIELQKNRAFYDPADILNADGSLKYKTLDEVPEKVRSVIDSIETRWFGKDANVKTTNVKLANRDKALEQLAKILRLDEDADEEEASSREARPVINIQINGDAQISTLPEE